MNLQSIRNWYTTIAIISFNCFIFFGIFTLAYIFLHSKTDKLSSAIEPLFTESGFFKNGESNFVRQYFKAENYSQLDQNTIKEIINETEDWVSTGSWQIDPWTGMLTNRAFSGHQINVDQHGRRKTIAPDKKYLDRPMLRIYMFGGSTMFGWGMPDNFTLSSLLQKNLQSVIKTHQIVISNYGVPYYNSGQEAILYLASLSQISNPPDIAIFLDGMNDSSNLPESKRPNMTIKFVDAIWEEYITNLLKQINHNRVNYLKDVKFNMTENKLDTSKPKDLWEKLRDAKTDEEITKLSVQYTLNNWKSIKALSSAYDITPFIFIQPARSASIKSMPKINQAYYKEIIKHKDDQVIFDISEIFIDVGNNKVKKKNGSANEEFSLSIDLGHYSESSMQAIADEMTQIILRRLQANNFWKTKY